MLVAKQPHTFQKHNAILLAFWAWHWNLVNKIKKFVWDIEIFFERVWDIVERKIDENIIEIGGVHNW